MIVKVRLTIYFNEKSKSSFFLWNRTPIAKPSPWIKIVFELLRQSMKPRDCVDKENVQISALNGYVTATSSSIIESGKSTRWSILLGRSTNTRLQVTLRFSSGKPGFNSAWYEEMSFICWQNSQEKHRCTCARANNVVESKSPGWP